MLRELLQTRTADSRLKSPISLKSIGSHYGADPAASSLVFVRGLPPFALWINLKIYRRINFRNFKTDFFLCKTIQFFLTLRLVEVNYKIQPDCQNQLNRLASARLLLNQNAYEKQSRRKPSHPQINIWPGMGFSRCLWIKKINFCTASIFENICCFW